MAERDVKQKGMLSGARASGVPSVENGGARQRDLILLENRYLAFQDKYGMLMETATHRSA